MPTVRMILGDVLDVLDRAPNQTDQCDGQATLLDLLDGGAA